MANLKIELSWEDDNGDEQQAHVPAKRVLCPECDGAGTTLCDSLRGVAFTAEDMADDPDFEEGYFGGRYDQTCRRCNGLRVVQVADPESRSWKPEHTEWLEAYERCAADREASQREFEAECAAERRAGA